MIEKQNCYERDYFGKLFNEHKDNIEGMSKRERKFFKNKFHDLLSTLNIASLSNERIAKQFRLDGLIIERLKTDASYKEKILNVLDEPCKSSPKELKDMINKLWNRRDEIIELAQDGLTMYDISYKFNMPYDVKVWSKISERINTMEDGVDINSNKNIFYAISELKKGNSLSKIVRLSGLFRDDADILYCIERNGEDISTILTGSDYDKYVVPMLDYEAKKKRRNKIRIDK